MINKTDLLSSNIQSYYQLHTITYLKKLIFMVLLVCSLQITAITSNMTHRVMSTSPLFYKMIDYSKRQISYEVEPIFSSMYDAQHTVANLTPLGKQTLVFNQQGTGDINPVWLNLMANNSLANYNSRVTFTPTLTQSGVLLHWYDQFDRAFIDIKTALVQCKSEIEINEVGGGNGLNSGILNAQQAFTQADWNYGTIGESNHVTGLDNIEIRFGASTDLAIKSTSCNMLLAGFAIAELPTGSGTKAKSLFEPQVGTNHWGLGAGLEALFASDHDLNFMIGANYRYLIPNWETRSFDLTDNGAWSRYLLLQQVYGLPTAPVTNGIPGINFFTQSAYVNGRSEINLYTRLAKQLGSCSFELSYNYFYLQAEKIGTIETIPTGYGIYTLTGSTGGAGGVATSSLATINQDVTAADSTPVQVTTSMLDKLSAQAGSYATNTLTARIEKINKAFIYGVGASIQVAQSASAISTWAIWAKFEFLFDTIKNYETDVFPSKTYDFEPIIDTKPSLPLPPAANQLPISSTLLSVDANCNDKENYFEQLLINNVSPLDEFNPMLTNLIDPEKTKAIEPPYDLNNFNENDFINNQDNFDTVTNEEDCFEQATTLQEVLSDQIVMDAAWNLKPIETIESSIDATIPLSEYELLSAEHGIDLIDADENEYIHKQSDTIDPIVMDIVYNHEPGETIESSIDTTLPLNEYEFLSAEHDIDLIDADENEYLDL